MGIISIRQFKTLTYPPRPDFFFHGEKKSEANRTDLVARRDNGKYSACNRRQGVCNHYADYLHMHIQGFQQNLNHIVYSLQKLTLKVC